jgi:DNA-binding CsgD family transcriptional regulator
MVCMPTAACGDDVREVDAESAWTALWNGQWTVLDHAARSTSHTIVCGPWRGASPAPLLGVDEVRLAVRYARGVPVKAALADSERPTAAARKLLASVKRKLLIQSDAQLVLLFGDADRDDVVPAPPGLAATIAGFGPAERLHLHYRWPAPRLPPTLSNTERSMVLDIVGGASREDLALSRGTSPRTVANQLASIFRKLRVGSRVELLVTVLALGRKPTLRRVEGPQVAAE